MTGQRQGYSPWQIALHWAIAVLILFNWFTGEAAGRALRQMRMDGTDPGTPLHVWIGMAVLILVVLRIAVRWREGAPPPPGRPGSPLVLLARAGHLLLYLLMLAVPLGGALVWYLGADSLGELHELAGNALFFLALAHAALALFHHYVLRDGLLGRMIRPHGA